MAAGRGAPVFVQLQADRARFHLFVQRRGARGISLAEKTQIHGEGLGRFEHAVHVPRAGSAGSGVGASGRASAAADQRGEAAGESSRDQLRADEVHVRVDAARRDDFSFARDYLRARAYDHAGRDAGHHVRIAGLADSDDAVAANADVGFEDAGVVDDNGVGDDEVERAVGQHGGRRIGPCRRAGFCRRQTSLHRPAW